MYLTNYICCSTVSKHCCGLLHIGSLSTRATFVRFLYTPGEERREHLIDFTQELRDCLEKEEIGGTYRGLVQIEMQTSHDQFNEGLDDSLVEDFKAAGWEVGPSWRSSEETEHRVTQFSLIVREL
jgi:hypothetical protein